MKKRTIDESKMRPQVESLPKDSSKLEGLRHEYTEVNENIRHYSTLRFAMLTVYFAALGGIISVAYGFFDNKTQNPDYLKLWGRIGGLLVTLLFYYYEVRLQAVIDCIVAVGKRLESQLDYSQLTMRPSWRVFRTTRVTQIFYWALILFWIVMIIKIVTVIFAA